MTTMNRPTSALPRLTFPAMGGDADTERPCPSRAEGLVRREPRRIAVHPPREPVRAVPRRALADPRGGGRHTGAGGLTMEPMLGLDANFLYSETPSALMHAESCGARRGGRSRWDLLREVMIHLEHRLERLHRCGTQLITPSRARRARERCNGDVTAQVEAGEHLMPGLDES